VAREWLATHIRSLESAAARRICGPGCEGEKPQGSATHGRCLTVWLQGMADRRGLAGGKVMRWLINK
jgi:hypothetical protein